LLLEWCFITLKKADSAVGSEATVNWWIRLLKNQFVHHIKWLFSSDRLMDHDIENDFSLCHSNMEMLDGTKDRSLLQILFESSSPYVMEHHLAVPSLNLDNLVKFFISCFEKS
jgi:hypothetical protein